MISLSFSRYAVSTILVSTLLVSGCSFSRSSSSSSSDDDEGQTVVVQQAPNYPQQMLQLNEAYEKKLISEQDYQKQRQKIQKEMNK